jgi:hypothetical protein
LIFLLRLGLPVTAFFVAFNPVWGFTWYFNTESWATGIYQKMTELRVDPWRLSMIDAVKRAYGDGDDLFRVMPHILCARYIRVFDPMHVVIFGSRDVMVTRAGDIAVPVYIADLLHGVVPVHRTHLGSAARLPAFLHPGHASCMSGKWHRDDDRAR